MSKLRSAAGALLYPVRRILDPRFHDVAHRIAWVGRDVAELGTNVEQLAGGLQAAAHDGALAQVDALAIIGQELRATTGEVAAISGEVGMVRTELTQLRQEVGRRSPEEHEAAYQARMARMTNGSGPAVLDHPAAHLINHAAGHRGFAAQAGLWMNPPLVLAHYPGEVVLAAVNERIVEMPFAMRALAPVPAGGRVLDVGSAESQVALTLASLGYRATALDLRRYPFAHPALEVVTASLEHWDAAPGTFDAALVISTVEHVGLGAYGEEPGGYDDRRAMRRVAELVRPGGVVVVTVPYGAASAEGRQRVYDRDGLRTLLGDLEVVERVIVERRETAWVVVDESTAHAVALVSARVPGP